MAKPRRSSPARDIIFRVDESDAKRAEAVALQATHEAAKIVPVPEMYRRAFLAGLPLVESCAGCRAGKCDAQHVSTNGLVLQSITVEGPMFCKCGAPRTWDGPGGQMQFYGCKCQKKPPDKLDKIHEVSGASLVPKAVATNDNTGVGQVDLFAQVPATPAPKKAKAPRKPKVVDENSPERVRLIDEFHLAYIAARGVKPLHTKRDWKAFSDLLETVGYDRASECIRNAFADPFWAPKVTIRDIAANPSKFAGAKVPESRPRSTQDEPLPENWS